MSRRPEHGDKGDTTVPPAVNIYFGELVTKAHSGEADAEHLQGGQAGNPATWVPGAVPPEIRPLAQRAAYFHTETRRSKRGFPGRSFIRFVNKNAEARAILGTDMNRGCAYDEVLVTEGKSDVRTV